MSLWGSIAHKIHLARLRRTLGSVGQGCRVRCPRLISHGRGIHLGQDVLIRDHARLECCYIDGRLGAMHIQDGANLGYDVHIGAAKSVTIGPRVLTGARVYISDHDHTWPPQPGGPDLVAQPVEIGEGCWLGEGCCILKGVTLGPGCVVGANAVVTRSFPGGSLVVGIPARPIKRWDSASRAWLPC